MSQTEKSPVVEKRGGGKPTRPRQSTPPQKIAGQWRFKKDVIDKWISEQSLERVTQNIKDEKR